MKINRSRRSSVASSVLSFIIMITASDRIARTVRGQEPDPPGGLRAIFQTKELLRNGEYLEALNVCDRLVSAYPYYQKGRLEHGLVLLSLGRIDESIAEFDSIILKDPTNIVAILDRAVAYINKHEYEKAIPDCLAAIRLDPLMHLAYEDRADIRIRLNQDERAIVDIEKAIRLVEREHLGVRSRYLRIRGEARRNLGRYFLALKDFDASIRFGSRNLESYLDRGEVLDRLGRHDEATRDYRKAIRLGPYFVFEAPSYNGRELKLVSISSIRSQSSVFSTLGRCCDRLGLFRSAISYHEQAIAMDPQNTYAYRCRAASRFTRGDLQGVHDDCETVRNLDKNDAKAVLYMTAIDAARKPEDAAFSTHAYIELRSWDDPDAATAAMIGALASYKVDQKQDAEALLEEASKHVPRSEWPSPIIRYLRRESTAKELLEAATNPDQTSEAHAYLGVDLSFAGKAEEAREHLSWVLKHGNLRCLAADLALNELRKIDGAGVVDRAINTETHAKSKGTSKAKKANADSVRSK